MEFTTSTMSDNVTNTFESFRFTVENCLLIVFGSIASLTTVVANIMLILLVCVDATLRRLSNNYYIISLACADLIVGIFVIPMFIVYTLLGSWPLGSFVCELWIIVDFTCVSASILGICMISLDRYWAITQPLRYFRTKNTRRPLLYVAGVWVLSFLCWIPAVVWQKLTEGDVIATDSTDCVYTPRPIYALVSSITVYAIPMAFMVYCYRKVTTALKEQFASKVDERELLRPRSSRVACCCPRKMKTVVIASATYTVNSAASVKAISCRVQSDGSDKICQVAPGDIVPNIHCGFIALNNSAHSDEKQATSDGPDVSAESKNANYPRAAHLQLPSGSEAPPDISNKTGHTLSKDLGLVPREKDDDQATPRIAECNRFEKSLRHRMHERATRTLMIIVPAFISCFLPFMVLFPAKSYCQCIPTWLYSISYWLSYFNSALNPFLYGFNKDVRTAFCKLVLRRHVIK